MSLVTVLWVESSQYENGFSGARLSWLKSSLRRAVVGYVPSGRIGDAAKSGELGNATTAMRYAQEGGLRLRSRKSSANVYAYPEGSAGILCGGGGRLATAAVAPPGDRSAVQFGSSQVAGGRGQGSELNPVVGIRFLLGPADAQPDSDDLTGSVNRHYDGHGSASCFDC